MSKKLHPNLTFKNVPRTWAELLTLYPLRPIADEIDRENATEIIDAMAGHDLNHDQDDYLEALATLLEAYESRHHPVNVPTRSGLELLQSFMQDHDMTTTRLGEVLGVDRSHAAKLARGDRSLTVDHIRKLAQHFKVRPDLFIAA